MGVRTKGSGLGGSPLVQYRPARRSDYEILEYARSNGYVVFTHDLDFVTILAATKADYPSVIQVRTQDVTPEHLCLLVVSALHQFEKHLKDGAIVTIDQKKLRARILPLQV